MKYLEQLTEKLNLKSIDSTFKSIENEHIKQERVYLNLNKQYQIYFIMFEDKPFLKVYIQRAKGFDYKNIKQSDLETEQCKKAKLQILLFLRNQEVEIKDLEIYDKQENVLLVPKSSKKKIEII